MLAEVTRLLPADFWLEQFRINETELHIQGHAEDAQQLIGLLNDSELLEEAEFRGQVRTDQRTGKERFTTFAQIVTPGDRDEDPAGS